MRYLRLLALAGCAARAPVNDCPTTLQNLATALAIYHAENGRYPVSERSPTPNYLKTIPGHADLHLEPAS